MELRKDYLLDRWAIISSGRGARPREFKPEESAQSEKICFFCPGNEHLTPPEIYRLEKANSWQVRVFPNKFPATELAGTPEIRTDNDFFTFSNPYGMHEIVVETPQHGQHLHDLAKEQILEVVKVYNLRMKELQKNPSAKYVVLFKNHGKEGGASLVHTHTQILSMNLVPSIIRQESDAAESFQKEKGHCPYCRIVDIEKGSYRKCIETKYFAAFTPYASRYNYELWLFPKRHLTSMQDLNYVELQDFADIFQKVLAKLKELGHPYNFYLHNAPPGRNLHFHLEFTPRIARLAGFEIGTEAYINTVPPEEAAKFFRGEI